MTAPANGREALVKLPELPEPQGRRQKYRVVGPGGEGGTLLNSRGGDLVPDGIEPSGQYTAEQMRDYAADAIALLTTPPRAEAEVRAIRAAVIEECAKAVPTTWLDPLLTGPNAVITGKSNCGDIQRLLMAVEKRIRSLAAHPAEPAGKGE